MQSSILGVAVCGCVSDAGVESSNVHAAPVCGGVGRCVCESHVAFISISSVQCVLHFYFIDGEGGGAVSFINSTTAQEHAAQYEAYSRCACSFCYVA